MIAVAAHPAGEMLAAVLHPVGVFGHEHLPTGVNGAFVNDHHAQFITNLQDVRRGGQRVEAQDIAVGRLV